ncbi:MAG: CBS domain-containing protein [Methanomicrobiaceae archaeon]|uniref:Cbs domain protein n=1 Tax=hydrocarbon metagenome TaxID=938273 RepID=A0A0W8FE72_9ZZZZ|nr:CBS domain-containing protein [Methanomicrobiaceae archaeon]MDD5419202.1 CBS domain-containing protein [Methanomicrobiaceae archaeon]
MGLVDCCRQQVVAVSPDTSILDVARVMEEKNVGSVMIVRGEKPEGIITDRDIVLRVCAKGMAMDSVRVEDVMTKNLITLKDDTGIYEAIERIKDAGIRRMPIVDDAGMLIGIITLDDVIRMIGEEMANIAENIEKQSPPLPR